MRLGRPIDRFGIDGERLGFGLFDLLVEKCFLDLGFGGDRFGDSAGLAGRRVERHRVVGLAARAGRSSGEGGRDTARCRLAVEHGFEARNAAIDLGDGTAHSGQIGGFGLRFARTGEQGGQTLLEGVEVGLFDAIRIGRGGSVAYAFFGNEVGQGLQIERGGRRRRLHCRHDLQLGAGFVHAPGDLAELGLDGLDRDGSICGAQPLDTVFDLGKARLDGFDDNAAKRRNAFGEQRGVVARRRFDHGDAIAQRIDPRQKGFGLGLLADSFGQRGHIAAQPIDIGRRLGLGLERIDTVVDIAYALLDHRHGLVLAILGPGDLLGVLTAGLDLMGEQLFDGGG